jgi:hypothetical protein
MITCMIACPFQDTGSGCNGLLANPPVVWNPFAAPPPLSGDHNCEDIEPPLVEVHVEHSDPAHDQNGVNGCVCIALLPLLAWQVPPICALLGINHTSAKPDAIAM